MTLLLATFGFGILSSSVPVFNMEAYLLVLNARGGERDAFDQLLIAFVASVGQNIGKLFWYYGSLGAVEAGFVQRRMASPKRQAQLHRWRAQVEGRPVRSGVLNFLSAAIAFPPFFVMAVVAGTLRMNVVVFVLTGTAGRTLFFWALLLGLGLLLP